MNPGTPHSCVRSSVMPDAESQRRPPQTPEEAFSAMEKRANDIGVWLKDEAPQCSIEQRHLDAGTAERAYWHHGYMLAVRDTLEMFRQIYQQRH